MKSEQLYPDSFSIRSAQSSGKLRARAFTTTPSNSWFERRRREGCQLQTDGPVAAAPGQPARRPRTAAPPTAVTVLARLRLHLQRQQLGRATAGASPGIERRCSLGMALPQAHTSLHGCSGARARGGEGGGWRWRWRGAPGSHIQGCTRWLRQSRRQPPETRPSWPLGCRTPPAISAPARLHPHSRQFRISPGSRTDGLSWLDARLQLDYGSMVDQLVVMIWSISFDLCESNRSSTLQSVRGIAAREKAVNFVPPGINCGTPLV